MVHHLLRSCPSAGRDDWGFNYFFTIPQSLDRGLYSLQYQCGAFRTIINNSARNTYSMEIQRIEVIVKCIFIGVIGGVLDVGARIAPA